MLELPGIVFTPLEQNTAYVSRLYRWKNIVLSIRITSNALICLFYLF